MMHSQDFNKIVSFVAEFQTTFKQQSDPQRAARLVYEEAKEVCEAMDTFCDHSTIESATDLLKEIGDLCYVIAGLSYQAGSGEASRLASLEVMSGDDENTLKDALFVFELLSPILTDSLIFSVITKVHASNMSKLGRDGEPIFREDGKVLKGPHYAEPDLTDEAREFFDIMAGVNAGMSEAVV